MVFFTCVYFTNFSDASKWVRRWLLGGCVAKFSELVVELYKTESTQLLLLGSLL